ncbi:MAG: phytoene/squalene synthase family protein [Pseudomonadota bacterium]
MIAPDDLAACRAAIADGSYSFHAASKLLPARIRDPAMALYAFCRLADDAVDLSSQKPGAVLRLRDRLEAVYAGRPVDAPADRAFAAVVERFDMPRALPEALLEGLAWDGMGRRYATLSDLRAYSARVASAVGAMMCVLMEIREADTLARACDLGVAMQLTNIARDVGEDARAGRLYAPMEWLDAAGIVPEDFLANPKPSPPVALVTRQLILEATKLYARSEAGIAGLPIVARPGIFAARHIYAAICGRIRANDYNSVDHRARTSTAQKLALVTLAALRASWVSISPRSSVLHARPLPETAFLVEAAAQPSSTETGWSDRVVDVLMQLEARDRNSQLDRPDRAAI